MNLQEKVKQTIQQCNFLTQEEKDTIVEKTIVSVFKKGTILLEAGKIPTKCYMVVEGCVREYILKEGEEKSTAFYLEGDTFTPQTWDAQPSKYYWVCAEDCILTVSDKLFEEEIRNALPRLDAAFQEIAINRINKAKEEWNNFITSSPEERYLNLLSTKPELLNRVPQHQIASYLGMKPQSLSRIRKRLANKK